MSAEPAKRAPPRPATLDDVLAELTALRAEVRELTAAQSRRRVRFSAADEKLVAAVHAAVGERIFSAWELVDHARLPGNEAMRDAILAAVGAESTLRLGKLLRRLEGEDVGGLRVVRNGQDRQGALWTVA